MMATTHAFAGLALAAAVAVVAPSLGTAAAVGGIAGGLAPDLDLLADHRRTLHFPVLCWLLATPAVVLALLAPSAVTVGAALFWTTAALHAVSDVFGGGLSPRPWEATSELGVYAHTRGEWLPPRRWIRYDGAPEDLALATLLALPGLLVFEGPVRWLAVAGLGVSVVYVAVRKRLPDWTPERFQ
jgi:hypothetical protein